MQEEERSLYFLILPVNLSGSMPEQADCRRPSPKGWVVKAKGERRGLQHLSDGCLFQWGVVR